MYTAEDIRNITFTKSLGGYKTGEVDDFIDICADTVEELTKTNADLKKKMELLANKVVEYCNDEDSIRTALLSAQRMGDTVLREANHKAGLILEDARIKADKIEETAKQQIKEQIDELEHLKKLVGDFRTQMLSVYREHLSMINVLPEYTPPEEETEEMSQTTENADAPETAEKAEETPAAEQTEEEVPVAPDAEAEEESAATMPLFSFDAVEEETEDDADEGSRFSNLKFGADYSIADDVDEDAETDKRFGHRRKR